MKHGRLPSAVSNGCLQFKVSTCFASACERRKNVSARGFGQRKSLDQSKGLIKGNENLAQNISRFPQLVYTFHRLTARVDISSADEQHERQEDTG